MKLNQYLAHVGIASRRKAVDLIKNGSIAVNNKVIKEPWYEVQEDDIVKVGGKKVKKEKKLYVLLNKPSGYITTCFDEKGRRTVVDLVSPPIKERVYPVGRLDSKTTGFLLLTNDGQLAQFLAHPRFGMKKTYHLTLDKPVPVAIIEQIKKGVKLKDGFVEVDHVAYLPKRPKNHIKIVLHSGKYQIIRRIMLHFGFKVRLLDRVSYAGLTKKGIPVGGWRLLTKKELDVLKRCVKKEKEKISLKK